MGGVVGDGEVFHPPTSSSLPGGRFVDWGLGMGAAWGVLGGLREETVIHWRARPHKGSALYAELFLTYPKLISIKSICQLRVQEPQRRDRKSV